MCFTFDVILTKCSQIIFVHYYLKCLFFFSVMLNKNRITRILNDLLAAKHNTFSFDISFFDCKRKKKLNYLLQSIYFWFLLCMLSYNQAVCLCLWLKSGTESCFCSVYLQYVMHAFLLYSQKSGDCSTTTAL